MQTTITERHPTSELIPRYSDQGYSSADVARRRAWLEERAGCSFHHVGAYSVESLEMRGNIENPIGVAQVPIGVAGPLTVRGEHADGTYYVPLATTEGALVRSYERGMRAISQAGGAEAHVTRDSNRTSPVFSFVNLQEAHRFATDLERNFDDLKSVAEATTRHGRLVGVQPRLLGRDVVVDLDFFTADAHGMNMISVATGAICAWIVDRYDVPRHYVLSGGSNEKRASASAFHGGKGKHVTAAVLLPRRIVRSHLHSTPERMHHMWQRTQMAQQQSGCVGYNGHYANGLAALFIACGQDVANIVNSAVGYTDFDVTSDDELYVSVTLPSLTIGTVGGGTGLGTAGECLDMLGCRGTGKALKFAEIIAATILAGELSFGSALTSGEFVNAHQQYGRNRPQSLEPS
jgi:hydroxymethylglutaryl-CoA reductase (NADPH)